MLTLLVRTATLAGLPEHQLRDVLGGTARRIALREEVPGPSRPVGPGALEQPLALMRIHGYLTMATPLLWTRQADTIGVLGLALNACAERDGHADVRERIAELLSCAGDLWRAAADMDDTAERVRISRATFRLVHLADILAVTTV
jgi:hypothetical protein